MSPTAASSEATTSESLNTTRHAKFLTRSIAVLPPSAVAADTSRMTIAYFGLSGFDLLGRDDLLSKERSAALAWIKRLYVRDSSGSKAGFHGGTTFKGPDGHIHPDEHLGHIAMTYTALATLRLLGDDLADFDRDALLRGVRVLQRPNGSFYSSTEGGENDMRFVYCAAAICSLLGDERGELGMDADTAVKYIKESVTYEGGIGQGPNYEAHGGSTFCAVATLSLLGRLETAFTERERKKLLRWCVNRLEHDEGFNGRPNKPADTCYSFWVGATLKLLRPAEEVDPIIRRSAAFVLATQDELTGGLSKWKNNGADPLHTYLGLAGLSLVNFPGLRELNPAINVSQRAVAIK